MRNVGSISEKTSLKVREAARDLGYLPNTLAGSLSSRKSKLVAIVIPSMSDVVFSEVLSGVNAILRLHGFHTFLGESNFDPAIEAELIKAMLSFRPAGLLLNGGMARSDEALRLLDNRTCPAIQLWDFKGDIFDYSAGPSHEAAGRLVAEHFISRGLSRIAYIGAELDRDLCARRRYQSFVATLREHGIETTAIIDENLPRQAASGRQLTERLMIDHPQVQAIHFLNDAMALGGLSHLHEASVMVPERVSVVGFNGTSLTNTVRTRLTTVEVPRRALGEAAAKALLDIMQGEKAPQSWQTPISIIQGNTTAST
ncbi:LacI family DNA-binding transcriptional regulator [Neorhizobium sp. NCHU2750]|uniref:LacI family DNA-binding transcriptional regulator n=1 Tax=Neorhizobium sp. NCHU2750 TaxID=1825976 RepID=UPI001FE0D87F